MSVTLKDIASSLGVSQMTVSYALRGHESIPAATRSRVQTVAKRMGYRPNASARAIRTGRFNAVGVLQARNLAHSGLGVYTLAGIQDELVRRDLRMVMSPVPDVQLTDPDRMPRILREWSVDGLLFFYNHHIPPAIGRMIEDHNIPAVWINSKFENDAVYPDDFGAVRTATRRLLELGHRRITYTSFSHAEHYSRVDRCAGYEAAMAEAGLQPRTFLPVHDEGPMPAASGRLQMARSLLSAPDRPTAIISYGGTDDVLPYLTAGLTLGMTLPGDLAMVCVNDGVVDAAGVDMATLRLPTYDIGAEAAKMLLDKIDGGGAAVPAKALPLLFHEGATCTPPRRA